MAKRGNHIVYFPRTCPGMLHQCFSLMERAETVKLAFQWTQSRELISNILITSTLRVAQGWLHIHQYVSLKHTKQNYCLGDISSNFFIINGFKAIKRYLVIICRIKDVLFFKSDACSLRNQIIIENFKITLISQVTPDVW